MAYLDLSRAVRGVDSLLRQRQGIQEFTADEACLFRVSMAMAERALILSDGTVLREGDAVLQLHFWNEHLPVMPSAGPNAAWATLMKRRMRHSLAVVAAYIEGERQLDAVGALHGAPPFASRVGALQMVRTAQRFGFDVIDPDAPPEWRDRIHAVFDSMLLWGLAYAFNPGRLSAKSRGLLRRRYQLWISRRKLALCYGTAGAAPARAESH
ncbi:MAG TPA: hypothetical protein VF502_16180 [Stellaceae bacterium]